MSHELPPLDYRTLFHDAPIGLALCRMDGSLIAVNRTYAAIIGHTVEETLSLSYWNITPRAYEKQENALLEKLKETRNYEKYQKAYIHKTGKLVPVLLQGVLLSIGDSDYIWSVVEEGIDGEQDLSSIVSEPIHHAVKC